METAAIIEMDVERDRKECIRLDLKVSGANRELGQWLLDHTYPNTVVAGWVGCSEFRIRTLRRWAERGFEGSPFWTKERQARPSEQPGYSSSRGSNQTLKSLDKSEDDVPPSYLGYDENDLAALAYQDARDREATSEVADPATVEDNALYTLGRIVEHAKSFKKIFKLSTFDREAEQRIITAIDRMIDKWRST